MDSIAHSQEDRTVMAPAIIEKLAPGWSMNRLLGILAVQEMARYADGADKLLLRMQFCLINIPDLDNDVFLEAFDRLTDCRFRVEEAASGRDGKCDFFYSLGKIGKGGTHGL